MDDIEEKDKGGAEAGSAESAAYVVDEHPDGGLRAWLVILGVSPRPLPDPLDCKH